MISDIPFLCVSRWSSLLLCLLWCLCGSLWGWCQAPGLQIPVKQICSGGQGLDFAVQHLQCWLQVSPVQASVVTMSKCSPCGCRVGKAISELLDVLLLFAPSNSELSSNAWRIDPEICLFLPLPAFTSWLLKLSVQHGVVPVVSCDTLFPTHAAHFLGFVSCFSHLFFLIKVSFYYQDLTKDLAKIKQNFHHAVKKPHLQNEKLTEKMQDTIKGLWDFGVLDFFFKAE